MPYIGIYCADVTIVVAAIDDNVATILNINCKGIAGLAGHLTITIDGEITPAYRDHRPVITLPNVLGVGDVVAIQV